MAGCRLIPLKRSNGQPYSISAMFSAVADWHDDCCMLKLDPFYVIMRNVLQNTFSTFFPSSGATPHKIMIFQVQGSSDRIWCNASRLVAAFCVSIVGHGRSSFLFRVSANQRDDEDTIWNTLGRTVKIVNKRGHERGHGHGKECLLCYWSVVGKDLRAYFPFYGNWLKLGSVDPSRVTTPHTENIRGTT